MSVSLRNELTALYNRVVGHEGVHDVMKAKIADLEKAKAPVGKVVDADARYVIDRITITLGEMQDRIAALEKLQADSIADDAEADITFSAKPAEPVHADAPIVDPESPTTP